MRPLPSALMLLSLGLLSTWLAGRAPDAIFRPDILLIGAIYAGLWFPARQAVPAAFIAGLLRDLGSIGPLGTGALSFSIAALAISTIRHELYREHPVTHILIAAAVGWIPAGLSLAPIAFGPGLADPRASIAAAALAVGHTAVAAPLVLPGLRWLAPLWTERSCYLDPVGAR